MTEMYRELYGTADRSASDGSQIIKGGKNTFVPCVREKRFYTSFQVSQPMSVP